MVTTIYNIILRKEILFFEFVLYTSTEDNFNFNVLKCSNSIKIKIAWMNISLSLPLIWALIDAYILTTNGVIKVLLGDVLTTPNVFRISKNIVLYHLKYSNTYYSCLKLSNPINLFSASNKYQNIISIE